MLFNNIKNINFKCFLWLGLILILLIGFMFFIFNTINLVSNADKNIFAYTLKVQHAYEEIDQIFERAEVNVNVMAESISNSYDATKQQNKAYNLHYIKQIDSLVKSILSNSPGADGCWFQLNADLPFSVEAYNWYEFKDNQFINLKDEFAGTPSMNRQVTPDDDPYYFDAINIQKPTWSDIYTDPDTKDTMITLSAPVYKDNALVGVVGIDISTNNLQQVLQDIQSILGNSELYLLNQKDNVILSQLSDNSNKVQRNYPFLDLFKNDGEGPIEYYDNSTQKTAVLLTLSNGYKIAMSFDDKVLFSGSNRIFNTVYALIIFMAILTIIVLINQYKIIPIIKIGKKDEAKTQDDNT